MKKFFSLFLPGLAIVALLISGCSGSQTASNNNNVVRIVQVNPPDMSQKMDAGEIDAFIAWEPFNAREVLGKQGQYLVQSADIWPGHPCCVLAAADSLEDPSVTRALVWSHIKATEFINNPANKDKVLKYAREFTGQDDAVLEEALSHIKYVKYPNNEQFRNYYLNLKDSGVLKKSYSDLGYQSEDRFMSDFLDSAVYEQVMSKLSQEPNWVPAPVSGETKVKLGFISRDLHELAVYVAKQEGYYSAVGLVPGKNLEVKEYLNGVAVMEAFKVKELDASYLGGAPATMKRVNDNIKVRVIAGANDEGSAIVTRKDSRINSISDLAGKVVAVPAIGTVQYSVLDMALKKEGLKPVLQ
ncbi:MAG: ABC transporter substrate-binding protein [Bacillota bacterium]